jgi:transcriptional regulator GlxA family with amidase domain
VGSNPQLAAYDEERYIAFVVYPGLTLLDLVGPLQTLRGLGSPYQTITVGEHIAPVPTDTGLSITPEATFHEIEQPLAIVVPGGGRGTIQAMADPAVQGFVRRTAEAATFVTSVCTGALILAAAGLLEGRDATTHWAYAEYLNKLGARYQRARWVENGKYITAAGVSAGIDMALHLAARLTSEDRAQRIQAGIEYDPQPPFGPMDWSKADVAAYWSRLGDADARRAYFTPLLASRPDVLAKMLA